MLDVIQRAIPVLQCPRTGASLIIEGQEVRSTTGEVYPIVNGKLILVRQIELFHTTPPSQGFTSQNIPEFTRDDVKDGWVVHLGSGNVPSFDPMVISTDILPLPNVDIVAEAEALPFVSGSIKRIVSGAVFEHLYDPLAASREVRRVLCDGGSFYIDTAFMQGYHGFPGHYFNMTSQACETFLVDDFILDHSVIPPSGSPIYQIENSLRRLLDALPRDEAARLSSLSVRDFLAETEKLKRVEWFGMLTEHIKRTLAASVVVRGTKPHDYERRRSMLIAEIGEERFARLKRDYYAARMGVFVLHGEVLWYRDRVLSQGRECAMPDPVESYLSSGHVRDPLVAEAWNGALAALSRSQQQLTLLRDRNRLASLTS